MLNKWITQHTNWIAFLLGSIAVQALPPFYHWYLLFLCLSGLLLLIDSCQTKKQAFARGYWFGFGFFAFGLSWVNNALLIHPEQTGWLIPITFLASGSFFGLFIGLPSFLCWLSKPFLTRYLSFALWIVVFEWLRSWILTGFPWNLWGTCLAFDLRLLQSASILGIYGLSLFVILIASAPAIALKEKTVPKMLLAGGIIVGLVLSNFTFGYWRINHLQDDESSSYTIRLVQPSIPQAVKWSKTLQQNHFQNYIDFSRKKPFDNIKMVIWGETASPYILEQDEKAMAQIINAIPPKGFLLTGTIRYEDNYYGGWTPYNSSLIINDAGLIEDFYDKSHLVPFGEYIPMKDYLPKFIRPIANIIGTFSAGQGPKVINLKDTPPFGIQICYEIIFPHQVINPTQKPEWLINLTNDGWYGLSSGPYQHLVSTQIRAIEEGLTVVRSANSGISALINRYGKIITSIPLHQKDILDISLPKKLSSSTPYNHFGNLSILLLCAICLFFIYHKPKIHC